MHKFTTIDSFENCELSVEGSECGDPVAPVTVLPAQQTLNLREFIPQDSAETHFARAISGVPDDFIDDVELAGATSGGATAGGSRIGGARRANWWCT